LHTAHTGMWSCRSATHLRDSQHDYLQDNPIAQVMPLDCPCAQSKFRSLGRHYVHAHRQALCVGPITASLHLQVVHYPSTQTKEGPWVGMSQAELFHLRVNPCDHCDLEGQWYQKARQTPEGTAPSTQTKTEEKTRQSVKSKREVMSTRQG
jgi:hypothetical protein